MTQGMKNSVPVDAPRFSVGKYIKKWNKLWLVSRARKQRLQQVIPNSRKLLIIPLHGLGDLAMTLPLLAALRNNRPDLEIDLLVSPRNAGLVADYPGLNRLIFAEINTKGKLADRQWRDLCGKGPWETVLYIGERAKTLVQVRLQQLPAKEIWALPCETKGIHDTEINALLDRVVGNGKEPHYARRMASVMSAFGIKQCDPLDFKMHLDENPKSFQYAGPVVLINPVGSQTGNTMGEEQISELVIEFLKNGWHIVAYEQCVRLLNKDLKAKITSLSSETIADAVGWLNAADIVLTTDTGIGHLSCAAERPTVILRQNEQWRANCDPLCGKPTVLYPEQSPGTLSQIPASVIVEALAAKLVDKSPV
ncbi:glycosyltransferase family 9 protein [Gallaecimonas mangrovi]|uniref:glycosyltransferase family 9 protein n=1 Tax=Gallaecimonas mangrovi TaxID=2291597 RepID=UPI000E1FCFB5|nr:glycosyltransferase family 9 protein [Gallaecimonas mangrovi]